MANQAQSGFQHPLLFGETRVLLQVLQRYGVEPGLRRRALAMLTGSIASAPLRAYEKLRYGVAERQPITQPPVFILGHWRGGTTQLHYLLSQDPQFGFMTTFQMFMPDMMFVGDKTLKPRLQALLPKTRPLDNLPLGLDMAQEEEFALAARSSHSFYHQWLFPRNFQQLRSDYALMDGAASTMTAWRHDYLALLQKISTYWHGKPLLIKNPTNTARIKTLLELFPDARFIHIVRDPYRIFLSSQHMYSITLGIASFHAINQQFQKHMILDNYQAMMRRYLEQRDLIRPERLVEVRFEDLEQNPWAVINTIYEHLGLSGLDQARAPIQRYLDSLGTFRKNTFTMNPADARDVEQAWDFAFDAWNYQRMPAANQVGLPS